MVGYLIPMCQVQTQIHTSYENGLSRRETETETERQRQRDRDRETETEREIQKTAWITMRHLQSLIGTNLE